MISPADLATYIETLKAAGVSGRVKIGDFEVTIAPPPPAKADAVAAARSAKKDYDTMLFACTEGIPDEEERT